MVYPLTTKPIKIVVRHFDKHVKIILTKTLWWEGKNKRTWTWHTCSVAIAFFTNYFRNKKLLDNTQIMKSSDTYNWFSGGQEAVDRYSTLDTHHRTMYDMMKTHSWAIFRHRSSSQNIWSFKNQPFAKCTALIKHERHAGKANTF